MDGDWGLISQLIQNIKLVDRGLASELYAKNVQMAIVENCIDQVTIDGLRRNSKLIYLVGFG